VHQHDEGRKVVEAAMGARVQTTYVADVAEGPDAERVIHDLAGIAAGRMTTRTWMW
jgi:basic membrane protein A and related proteins